MKTIFDIGSNVGHNIPYYLLKADKVVAFEANPSLAAELRRKFNDEVSRGQLVIEGCVLLSEHDKDDDSSEFFVHKENSVLSQFNAPIPSQARMFQKVCVPNLTLGEAIDRHGEPWYAKIDIEHYDHVVLSEFFRLKVFPKYLSVECHTPLVSSIVFGCEEYAAFKLVEGALVHKLYSSSYVLSMNGEKVKYSFPKHSAGPFGEDVNGVWYDKKSMKKELIRVGFGWVDLHASRVHLGEQVDVSISANEYRSHIMREVHRNIPESVKRLYRHVKYWGQ